MSKLQINLAEAYDDYVEHQLECTKETIELKRQKYEQKTGFKTISERAHSAFHHMPKY